MSKLENTTWKWIIIFLQFHSQEGADVRPKDRLPALSPFLHTLIQNQKRMLMQKERDPMERLLEQVPSQGFLSERSMFGFLGF